MNYVLCREIEVYVGSETTDPHIEYVSEDDKNGKGVWNTDYDKAYKGFRSPTDAIRYLRHIVKDDDELGYRYGVDSVLSHGG